MDPAFGPFRLDGATESVWRDGDEIRLRPKTFALLRYLAEHPDRLVTKDELLEAVWPGVVVGDAALAVCIAEIRKALGDDAWTPRFVETVHRRGYRFVGRARAATIPPVAARIRTNLPRQLTSFIGREHEMRRVTNALGGAALVTLTGAGGVGKTRLALEVAATLLSEFTDGVFLVDLAPLTDADRVPAAVATALGVPGRPGRPIIEPLLESLRPKTILVVLDNCEHLLKAAAGLTDALLRECPGLRILATSREGLGVAGEALQVIPPLAVPAAGATLSPEALLRFDAVRLFAERARDVLADGAVDETNVAIVADICRRLDGIPLAIELAAARVRAMAVEEIAGRLDDRFRLLTGGLRTALPRHQTLRGVLDWSHQLLSEAERVLLRRLSIFAGAFTLDAAERVGAGRGIATADILDLLTQLVARPSRSPRTRRASGTASSRRRGNTRRSACSRRARPTTRAMRTSRTSRRWPSRAWPGCAGRGSSSGSRASTPRAAISTERSTGRSPTRDVTRPARGSPARSGGTGTCATR